MERLVSSRAPLHRFAAAMAPPASPKKAMPCRSTSPKTPAMTGARRPAPATSPVRSPAPARERREPLRSPSPKVGNQFRPPARSPVPSKVSAKPPNRLPVSPARIRGSFPSRPLAEKGTLRAHSVEPMRIADEGLDVTPSTKGSSNASPASGASPQRRRQGKEPLVCGSLQEMAQQLEVLRREAKQLKSVEGAIMLGMVREDKSQKMKEKCDDVMERITSTKTESNEMREFVAARKNEEKKQDIAEHMDFLLFKREKRQEAREWEVELSKEEYAKNKEFAEWRAQHHKKLASEGRRAVVDAHLETFQMCAEHALCEEEREKEVLQEQREEAQRQALELALHRTASNRDQLHDSVQLLQSAKELPPRANLHLAARP